MIFWCLTPKKFQKDIKLAYEISTESTSCIRALLNFNEKFIIIGNNDGDIFIYDYKLKLKNKFKGHKKEIRCFVQISEELFASAGNDREIKTWNIKGKNKKIFSEKHNDVIRRLLLLKDGRIASICIDGELKIWSIKGTCERTIKANADCALIQLENEKLCISCLDFSLKIINLKGKEKKNCLKGMKTPLFKL